MDRSSGTRTITPARVAGAGFTLVELLVVVAIIAVLLGLLLPATSLVRNQARKSTTNSVITSVSNAIAQFKADKQRLPGYFSTEQLGRAANTTNFTQMENALLELAGGVQPETASRPSAPNDRYWLEFTMPGSTAPTKIDTLRVGAADGPGYLSVSNAYLARAADLDQPAITGTTGEDSQMPDILDAWGRPLMLWTKNDAAGSNWVFAAMDSTMTLEARRAGISSPTGAYFYWQTNNGYLSSRRQRPSSLLSSDATDVVRHQCMEAVLGAAAFPVEGTDGLPYPGAPRGDFIVHSAGSDEVFLSSGVDGASSARFTTAVYNFDLAIQQGDMPPAGGRPVEKFDDIVRGNS